MNRFVPLFFAVLSACGEKAGTGTTDTADTSPADVPSDTTDTVDTTDTEVPEVDTDTDEMPDTSDTSDASDTSDTGDTTPLDRCQPGCGETCGHEQVWTCAPLFSGESCLYRGEELAHFFLMGLDRLDFDGGLPSRLIAHGRDTFPVLVDDRHHTVIAGAYVGQGRALVVGHEGPLGHGASRGTGFFALWQNTSSWLAGLSPGQISGVIGVMPGFADLATGLAALGWTTRSLEAADLTPGGLATIDVLVMDTYADLPAGTVQAIHQWLEAGGGLLAGGQAWWWAVSDPTHIDAAADYPGNALLAPTGITITAATASDAPYPLPDSVGKGIDHAGVALSLLTRELDGCQTLGPEDRARAASAAGLAIDTLPLDSDFIAGALPFSDAVGPVVPTAAAPLLPGTAPIQALAARLQIRLALDADPDTITAHAASADFPGPVPADAPRLSRTIPIDGSFVGAPSQLAYGAPRAPVWRTTGLYAAPGDVITVTIPDRATSAGLAAQIGIHTDTLWEADTWRRLPRIVATRPLERPTTRIASGFGGPLFITVPVGASLGDLEVTIENAVAMPTYRAGSDWPSERIHQAPWADLIGSSFILHVPTADARTVTNPAALMTLWDTVQDKNAWLAGFATARARAERFVVDRQISAGWMHSGYPMMAHLESTSEVLTLTAPSTVGAWGPLHELGHNHQNLDWVLPGTTESSVNLWSVYISEEVLRLDRAIAHPDLEPTARAGRIDAWLAGTDRDWSVWMALETYLQLQEAFGWDFYHRLFARYLALPPAARPGDDQARLQAFITFASLEAARDLSAFFAAWGLVANANTLAAIDHLPPWLDHPLAR